MNKKSLLILVAVGGLVLLSVVVVPMLNGGGVELDRGPQSEIEGNVSILRRRQLRIDAMTHEERQQYFLDKNNFLRELPENYNAPSAQAQFELMVKKYDIWNQKFRGSENTIGEDIALEVNPTDLLMMQQQGSYDGRFVRSHVLEQLAENSMYMHGGSLPYEIFGDEFLKVIESQRQEWKDNFTPGADTTVVDAFSRIFGEDLAAALNAYMGEIVSESIGIGPDDFVLPEKVTPCLKTIVGSEHLIGDFCQGMYDLMANEIPHAAPLSEQIHLKTKFPTDVFGSKDIKFQRGILDFPGCEIRVQVFTRSGKIVGSAETSDDPLKSIAIMSPKVARRNENGRTVRAIEGGLAQNQSFIQLFEEAIQVCNGRGVNKQVVRSGVRYSEHSNANLHEFASLFESEVNTHAVSESVVLPSQNSQTLQ